MESPGLGGTFRQTSILAEHAPNEGATVHAADLAAVNLAVYTCVRRDATTRKFTLATG